MGTSQETQMGSDAILGVVMGIGIMFLITFFVLMFMLADWLGKKYPSPTWKITIEVVR